MQLESCQDVVPSENGSGFKNEIVENQEILILASPVYELR